jgi:hypothetical protein
MVAHVKSYLTFAATLCIDDETVDCARMNTIFHICKDIQQAKLVCPKFCGLCQLGNLMFSFLITIMKS